MNLADPFFGDIVTNGLAGIALLVVVYLFWLVIRDSRLRRKQRIESERRRQKDDGPK